MDSDHRLALPVGHRFAEFRIVKVLGQGGFGITYLAQDTLLDVEVAIKELLPRDFATRIEGVTVVPRRPSDAESFAWARQRFINEARTLASLRHDNIVHVHRFLEAQGTAYMVMEFVHGRNLLDWIKAHRKPTEQTLKSILLPLLDGLDCVHRKKVLHRDISPENIFVTADHRPMLLDFGSARNTVDRDKGLTGVIRPGYSPIEQYQSTSPQGDYTDLYALSGVMVQAITGEVPPLSIDRCGGADPHHPLAQRYRGKYGDDFLRALDRGFAVLPEDRPQNVAEFRRMLAGDFGRAKSKIVSPRPPEKPPRQKAAPSPRALAGPKKQKQIPWLPVGALFAVAAIGAGIYSIVTNPPSWLNLTTNSFTPAEPVTEIAATKGEWKAGVYTNSLGMQFVPVPGTKVLFCVHQTRRRDYAAYAQARPKAASEWENATAWNKVPAGRGPDEPVVMISWNEASAFCQWLSEIETKRTGTKTTYRLPAWEEWRAARGNDKYPWGNEDTPPKGAGNYADLAARRVFGATFTIIPNYDDGFATTSPVGTFRPNKLGLFDFASNVQEWSVDQDLATGEMLVLGASWKDASPDALAAREKPQYHESPDSRRPFIGFRCVLVSPAK